MPHKLRIRKYYVNFGQPTLPVYRIQWYLTSELVALKRDFGDTYNAKRIGRPAADKAAPQGQGRLAAYPIDIGRIHLHRKWQELWAELS
jgi:hypothetical protein